MFGYIIINKPELKFKEYDIYHAYYCGMCRALRELSGYKGQLSLNYDLTFLAILLSSLYESKTETIRSRCLIHPFHQYDKFSNECIDYAAKMSLVLSYFKCQDDWLDEKKYGAHLYEKWIYRTFMKVKEEYPLKVQRIEQFLKDIQALEKENCQDIDQISGCFGKIMGDICAYRDDEWHDELYEMGFYLGKFIYLMDAYDDLEEDQHKQNYNPLSFFKDQAGFEEYCYGILEMMIAKVAEIFECLPIIENIDMLRNIIYSGVWSRYELRKKKRMEESS